jgi:hypothetical protein
VVAWRFSWAGPGQDAKPARAGLSVWSYRIADGRVTASNVRYVPAAQGKRFVPDQSPELGAHYRTSIVGTSHRYSL